MQFDDAVVGAKTYNIPAEARRTTAAPAVRLHAVSKTYKIYATRMDRVREALDPARRPRHREFRALHDVDIELPRGSTVGILGVNGSGKSTLLQIICGIIPATSGTVEVNGSIAALIELGAGFNPDMTGRENVTVNAIIMGKTQAQINERMSDIETFADIGDFFDQPLKTYSSGMAARVGFAMSIYVDPDILVIDEALAVGDARFQQKCFRRFRELQEAGKTIVFVTHDRFSVPRLCTHAIVLHGGRVVYDGKPEAATDCYNQILINGQPQPIARAETIKRLTPAGTSLSPTEVVKVKGTDPADMKPHAMDASDVDAQLSSFAQNQAQEDRCSLNPTYNKNERRAGLGGARVVDYLLAKKDQLNPSHVTSGDTLTILVRVVFDEDVESPIVGMAINSKDGVLVYSTNTIWLKQSLREVPRGSVRTYRFDINLMLGANDWFLDLAVARSQTEVLDFRGGMINIRCDPVVVGHGLANLPVRFRELP